MNSGIPEQIKQALSEAAESVLQRAYGYWEGNSAGSFEAVQYYEKTAKNSPAMRSLHSQFTDRILTALAPHFTQQGQDSARLDWLEANRASVSMVIGGHDKWEFAVSKSDMIRASVSSDLRAALDAARLNTEIKTK